MSDTLVLKSNTSRLARSTSLTTGKYYDDTDDDDDDDDVCMCVGVVPNSSVAAGSVWHRDGKRERVTFL